MAGRGFLKKTLFAFPLEYFALTPSKNLSFKLSSDTRFRWNLHQTYVSFHIIEELSPKVRMSPFFVVTWPPNLIISDTFKEISGPDSDEKLAPNIIDKYTNLTFIHLEKASLKETFLNNANLSCAQLAGTNLHGAHLEGADLSAAHLEGKCMRTDDLQRARKWFHGPRWRGMEDMLDWEDLEQLVEEFPEELPPADLREAFFDAATKLDGIILGEPHYGWVRLADMHWGDVNLTIVKWSQVQMLGDEHEARL